MGVVFFALMEHESKWIVKDFISVPTGIRPQEIVTVIIYGFRVKGSLADSTADHALLSLFIKQPRTRPW